MSPSSFGQTPVLSAWPAETQLPFRWVSTNNPFYVVSAGLFLAGLWLSFGDPRQIEDTWMLMAGLTAYTVLLAVTAVLLIRFANVWDDARTVLLLVVLMFLATSVTFDRVIVFDVKFGVPWRGFVCNALGLVLAIGVSEALLRAVRLALPWCYRLPYYLLLAIFFLYPLALTPYLNDPRGPGIMWGLFGFSSAAALAFLTLLPAIRLGKKALENNGSPWPWPLYPWTLFGLLALAVPGRAILLCYSMHLIDVFDLYDMTFGPYFLMPFGLVVCVLLLEAGIMTQRPGLLGAALALPMGLLGLALIGHRSEAIYVRFLAMFSDQLGADPVYCTLLAAAGFYVYAAVRRTPWAIEALTAVLAVLTFVGPQILTTKGFAAPQPAPLIVASTLLIGLGILRGGSWRCLIGASSLAIGIALAIPVDLEISPYRWPIALHVILAAMLIVGWVFDDELARSLRFIGPSVALLACLAVMLLPLKPPESLPAWVPRFYPLVMAILLAGYGYWLWHPPTLVIAGVILVAWSAASGWHIYRVMRSLIVGLDYLVLSLIVFALAIVISLAKSGLLSRWQGSQGEEASD